MQWLVSASTLTRLEAERFEDIYGLPASNRFAVYVMTSTRR